MSARGDVGHTAGRWHFDESIGVVEARLGPTFDGEQMLAVQVCALAPRDREANGRLIAAAPELESALTSLRNEVHAILALASAEIQQAAGYANLKCLENRLTEADAALAKVRA